MQTLAFRLAFAGNSLLLIFVASVLFDLFPFKIFDPTWLSSTIETLLQSSVFALVGIIFLLFSSYFDPDNIQLQTHQRRILRLCCVISIAFLLLIPLQFFVAGQLVSRLKQQEVYQFEFSIKRVKFLAQKVEQAETFDQLQKVMKVYQSIQLPESERYKSLQSTKNVLLRKINEALTLLKNRRNPLLVTAKAWEQYKIATRNSLFSFTYFLAFAAFAQRRDSQRSWLQEMMEGSLNLLYSVLHRRETQLANQAPDQDESILLVPSAPQPLDKLQQHEIIDHGWLSDQTSHAEDRIHWSHESRDPDGSGESIPSEYPPSRRSGLLAWLRGGERRRQDDPTTFLETLAEQHTAEQADPDESAPGSLVNPEQHSSESQSADEPLIPVQRRPGSPSFRRQKITDLDYFEQLADEEVSQQDLPNNQPKPPH